MWIAPRANAPDGFICGSFSGDDWKICKDYIKAKLGLAPGDVREIRAAKSPAPVDHGEEAKIHRAIEIWSDARDPRGSLAETYLASRALILPDGIFHVLRFHPSCPWGRERIPALVALFRDIVTDEARGIHRTALSPDGQKIDRRMLGTAAGAAIKLDEDAEVSAGLVIGEGVETCLAARQMGFRPVWALGSVGAIYNFPVLPGIGALTILAEIGDASTQAIEKCGRRWCHAGREVIIAEPTLGSDLNDALRGAA
jgi:hypothetical protein